MASGREHDRLTLWLSLPFALLWWPALGPSGAATALVSFLVGGLWLSPDLDTPSNPTRRWGPWRCSGSPTASCCATAPPSPTRRWWAPPGGCFICRRCWWPWACC
ncbi:DUF2227 family putative metal-binding protein [Cyanobium sp. ATX-6F1]